MYYDVFVFLFIALAVVAICGDRASLPGPGWVSIAVAGKRLVARAEEAFAGAWEAGPGLEAGALKPMAYCRLQEVGAGLSVAIK